MQKLGKVLEMNQQKICSGASMNPPKNNPKTTSSPSSAPSSQSKRMDLVFSRFAAFYGHVWRSQFKSEGFLEFAKKEWHEGLSPFSDEVLNKAVLHYRDFCEMPPTLPQLISECRRIRKRLVFYVANRDSVPAKAEVVTLYLNQCKDILIKP